MRKLIFIQDLIPTFIECRVTKVSKNDSIRYDLLKDEGNKCAYFIKLNKKKA